jgi:multidrug efflux pump subunit AcrB
MNIARASIDRPLIVWLIMLTCLFGGIWGFSSLGRLEDPAFTIKQAVVITQYPGASAQEVATQVTEPLESAIQQMDQVDEIISVNRPGVSRIDVLVRDTISPDELPDIWTELRERLHNAQGSLPAEAREPRVDDGFGDVYGIFFAVTADGFTNAEKHGLGSFLRRELLSVDGVADVEVDGLPEEAIFVEPDMSIVLRLGINPQVLIEAIVNSNSVLPAGSLTESDERILIQSADGSDSVSEIASLTVGVGGELINITDIADVSRGLVRIPMPSFVFRARMPSPSAWPV